MKGLRSRIMYTEPCLCLLLDSQLEVVYPPSPPLPTLGDFHYKVELTNPCNLSDCLDIELKSFSFVCLFCFFPQDSQDLQVVRQDFRSRLVDGGREVKNQ